MAGASWILFKDFFSDTDNERIEVGIYILLKNQVNDWNINPRKTKACVINSYLASKVYTFLFDNGIDYIARAYKKRKDENLAIKNEERIKTKQHALQSAVAQVFARNFAHNIGSHVAIRATNRMAKERIAELYKIDKLKFKDNTAIEDWLDYMGEKLDLFEVARNEFLAEYKLPAKNAMLYRDVILPFCENTLLMDNIAHSEGVHYGENGFSNKLRIKVLIKDKSKSNGIEIKAEYPHLKGYNIDDKIVYPDNFPYLVESREIEIGGRKIKYSIDESFSSKLLTGTNDIEICLTNEHTIYSILENLIRNSAKHNKDKLQSQDLLITINIEDTGDDDYYKIQVYDNISKVSEEQLNKFAKSIATSLITNDGEIQKESLGIADIKINAHLLKTDADITPTNLSDALTLVYQESESKIFDEYKTEENPSEEKKYNFGYQFKLCKPKKVVWIGKAEDNNLKKKGIICIQNFKDFKPERQAKKKEPLANYQFAMLEIDAVKDLTNGEIKDGKKTDYEWDDFLIKLPHRVLLNISKDELDKLSGKEFDALKKLEGAKRILCVTAPIPVPPTKDENEKNIEDWDFEFLKSCWENWLRKWVKDDEKARLIVYFEDYNFEKNWKNLGFICSDLVSVNTLSGTTTDLSFTDSFNTTDRIIIYDHHAKGYIELWSKLNGKINFVIKDAYFQFDKSSDDYVKFAFPDSNPNNKKLFVYEAIEAGLNKIAVVDERVSEKIGVYDKDINHIKNDAFKSTGYTKGATDIKPNYGDLANNGNVFLVSNFMDNNINSLKNNLLIKMCGDKKTLSFNFVGCRDEKGVVINKGFLNCTDFGYNAIIIHRTYLQKMFDDYKEMPEADIMHLLYTNFKRVIVVSGGGYPHSINVNLKFKPFSQLSKCFIKYPSKISLNKII